jgi:hypothetical protein
MITHAKESDSPGPRRVSTELRIRITLMQDPIRILLVTRMQIRNRIGIRICIYLVTKSQNLKKCSNRLIFHTFWLVICKLIRIRIRIQFITLMLLRIRIRSSFVPINLYGSGSTILVSNQWRSNESLWKEVKHFILGSVWL